MKVLTRTLTPSTRKKRVYIAARVVKSVEVVYGPRAGEMIRTRKLRKEKGNALPV